MRIGIDARPTQGRFTGDSTYWRGLIEGLSRLDTDDEVILYLDERLPSPQVSPAKPLKMQALRAINWRLWSLIAFPKALRNDAVDIAHVQYTIPPSMPCPVITTVHDVSFKRHPEFFKMKDRVILDSGMKRAAKQASRILAVSKYTKKEILELYPRIPEKKIEVVYEGVDRQFRPIDRSTARTDIGKKYGIDSPYVLTVGVIQPRKNLPRLLEGFAIMKSSGFSEYKLVIAGKKGWMESDLSKQVSELGIQDSVVFPGYVPYEDLPVLYSAAEVFVYPSVYEGFGLPPAESMACGTPVITGDRSSLPEVVGEAGLMVNPYEPEAFAIAIAKLLTSQSLWQEMSAAGLMQARKFSWDKMAEHVMKIYRENA